MWTCAGLPMTLLVVLAVAWLASNVMTDYVESREQISDDVNQMVWQMESFPGARINQIEAIRSEQLASLNRELIRDAGLLCAILAMGICVPIIVSRYVTALVLRNLRLLERHFDSSGQNKSSLMPHVFDFAEFQGVVAAMQRSLRKGEEVHLRSQMAEKQLVLVNADLKQRAADLKNCLLYTSPSPRD